jgi:hypothetical protein
VLRVDGAALDAWGSALERRDGDGRTGSAPVAFRAVMEWGAAAAVPSTPAPALVPPGAFVLWLGGRAAGLTLRVPSPWALEDAHVAGSLLRVHLRALSGHRLAVVGYGLRVAEPALAADSVADVLALGGAPGEAGPAADVSAACTVWTWRPAGAPVRVPQGGVWSWALSLPRSLVLGPVQAVVAFRDDDDDRGAGSLVHVWASRLLVPSVRA